MRNKDKLVLAVIAVTLIVRTALFFVIYVKNKEKEEACTAIVVGTIKKINTYEKRGGVYFTYQMEYVTNNTETFVFEIAPYKNYRVDETISVRINPKNPAQFYLPEEMDSEIADYLLFSFVMAAVFVMCFISARWK